MLLSNSVVIMGVPGSGGSTLAKHLRGCNPGFQLIKEPLPPSIESSLKEFYHDPVSHTLHTQLEFIDAWVGEFAKLAPDKKYSKVPKFLRSLATKVAMTESMLFPPTNLIVDASPLSVLYHSHTSRDMGWLDDDAFISVMAYYDIMKQYWGAYMPSEVIYNKVSAEEVMRRITVRGRPYEQSISLEYVERLILNLEELLSTRDSVTIVDGEKLCNRAQTCKYCDSKGFTVHEHFSHGKLEASKVYECAFCPN